MSNEMLLGLRGRHLLTTVTGVRMLLHLHALESIFSLVSNVWRGIKKESVRESLVSIFYNTIVYTFL